MKKSGKNARNENSFCQTIFWHLFAQIKDESHLFYTLKLNSISIMQVIEDRKQKVSA